MLMNQLQKALQESHSIISDLTGNLLNFSIVPETTKQTIAMEGVNHKILS